MPAVHFELVAASFEFASHVPRRAARIRRLMRAAEPSVLRRAGGATTPSVAVLVLRRLVVGFFVVFGG